MSSESRHQLIEQLGAGGFGTVFRALDTQLDREVAIKRLNTAEGSSRAELNSQLLREAKILATLKHPNIVTIYDIHSQGDSGEIIMELIEGITLDELIDKNPLLPEDFVFIATQLLSALAAAHENNVLHCDLKPRNIMVRMVGEESYEMKILDFGMSPAFTETGSQSSSSSKMMGSIHFMAPEQFDNSSVSKTTDIYSIGCIFYYILTGFKPFAGDTSVQIMASHVTGNYQPITTVIPNLDPALAKWVEKHLVKDPNQRHESARESLNELLDLNISNPEERLTISSLDYPDQTRRPSALRRKALSPLDKNTRKITINEKSSSDSTDVLSTVDADVASKLARSFTQPNHVSISKAKSPKTLIEEVIKVDSNATWYFTINDSRKGPISLQKLSSLLHLGHLSPNESVWHPSFRDWQKIAATHELQESLKSIPSELPQKSQKSPLQNQALQVTQPHSNQAEITEEKTQFVSCKFEILFTLLGSIAVGSILWQLPKLWQLVFITFGAFLLMISMIRTRVCMVRESKQLFAISMVSPVLSDVFYSLFRPHLALKNLAPLLLGLALLGYSLLNRYPEDAFHLIGADPILREISQLLTFSPIK